MSDITRTKCADCGTECSTNRYSDDFGNPVCRRCFKELYFICDQTGIVCSKSGAVLFGDKWCSKAVADKWPVCHFTGEKRPDLCKVKLKGKYVYMTENAKKEHGFICPYDGVWYPKEEGILAKDGKMYSKKGYGNMKNKIGGYHDRSRGSVKFLNTKDEEQYNERYFGIEIEKFVPSEYHNEYQEYAKYFAAVADDVLSEGDQPHCFAEWDSSVSYGYETIFFPMTKSYMRSYKMRNRIWELQKLGLNSFNTGKCGMHIHVSRNCVKPIVWWKVVALFAKCRGKITAMTGRNDEALKQWAAIPKLGEFLVNHDRVTYESKKSTMPKFQNESRGDKYTAINFTKKETVEFRLFNGTLNGDRFIHNVNFVDAVLDFCTDTGYTFFMHHTSKKIWDEFCAFFKARYPKSFKYIHEYVELKKSVGIED